MRWSERRRRPPTAITPYPPKRRATRRNLEEREKLDRFAETDEPVDVVWERSENGVKDFPFLDENEDAVEAGEDDEEG
ncbi:hypothetical protein ACKS0A_04457 [Histoplasma ohiense]